MDSESSELQAISGLQRFDDATFDEVATATKFLPRLQLFSGNSSEVKEGKVPMGTFGVVTMKGQPIIGLTDTVDVLLIVWRPKALDMSGEEIISVFDPSNEAFRQIAIKSEDQDSSCMYGPEFLIWIPSIQKFATFFCGSKTARREAVNIKTLCGKLATLKSQLIRKGKYVWHGPKVFECSTPCELPDMEEVKEKVFEFNNPPQKTVEAVDPATTGTARAR